MKNFKTTLLFGGLLALAASLSAQSTLIRFDAPFAFVAGGTVMPAGSYTIEEPASRGVLLLRGGAGNSTAMLLAVEGGPTNAAHAGVTFSHSGSDVVLYSVNVPGASNFLLVNSSRKTAATINAALPRK